MPGNIIRSRADEFLRRFHDALQKEPAWKQSLFSKRLRGIKIR